MLPEVTVPAVMRLPLGQTLNWLMPAFWRLMRLPVPAPLVLLMVSMSAVAWLDDVSRVPARGYEGAGL